MNNMPAYCMGMAQSYEGPIEDEEWLDIPDSSRRNIATSFRNMARLEAARLREAAK